jgi:hypothetical protein
MQHEELKLGSYHADKDISGLQKFATESTLLTGENSDMFIRIENDDRLNSSGSDYMRMRSSTTTNAMRKSGQVPAVLTQEDIKS